MVINFRGLHKYESNHIDDEKLDGQTRTEVGKGNRYELIWSNVVTHAVTERWTLRTRFIIDTL